MVRLGDAMGDGGDDERYHMGDDFMDDIDEDDIRRKLTILTICFNLILDETNRYMPFFLRKFAHIPDLNEKIDVIDEETVKVVGRIEGILRLTMGELAGDNNE